MDERKTYEPWETVWTVWKLRDGELASVGRDCATEAEAQAVADGLPNTETKVLSTSRVRRDPLPSHLTATWDAIETGFHEYASQVTKEELAVGAGETSFHPDFANWAVGMKAAQEWLAAHDAQIRRDAGRAALDGLIVAAQREHDRASAPYSYRFEKVVSIATDYRDAHHPEETP